MSEFIVITGGSGFIGTHLIRRLIADGEKYIISIDLKPPRETLSSVDYCIWDIRQLSSFKFPSKVKRIYNLAAIHTTPGHPYHEYYSTNILGALEVTSTAARCETSEIIFTSSISVYGPGEEIKTEDTPLNPNSAYGYSKMLAEQVHRHWYAAKDGRRLTIVRPAVVFGPGEKGNFTRLASLMKKGIFIYPGRKDTVKACIYVDDLISSIEFGRRQEMPFLIFNAAYPQRYTLEDIVETFIKYHFPKTKTLLLPRQFVITLASFLKATDTFGLGINPDRVMKLLNSTDVYPSWLVEQAHTFPDALKLSLQKWAHETNNAFN